MSIQCVSYMQDCRNQVVSLMLECTGTCSGPCSIASSLASLEPSGVETEGLGEGYSQESDQLVD